MQLRTLTLVAGIMVAAALPSVSAAQLLGDRTEASTCAVAIRGDVKDSKVSAVCGIPPEILESVRKSIDDFIEGRLKDTQTLAAKNEQIIDLLNTTLNLTRGQIRAALVAAGEADIPPDKLAEKLIEIAGHYKESKAAVVPQPNDPAGIVALKAELSVAIEKGEPDKADQLLADIQKIQDDDFNLKILNAAETRAERGTIALGRLRYAEAAKHFANAAAVFPPGTTGVRLICE